MEGKTEKVIKPLSRRDDLKLLGALVGLLLSACGLAPPEEGKENVLATLAAREAGTPEPEIPPKVKDILTKNTFRSIANGDWPFDSFILGVRETEKIVSPTRGNGRIIVTVTAEHALNPLVGSLEETARATSIKNPFGNFGDNDFRIFPVADEKIDMAVVILEVKGAGDIDVEEVKLAGEEPYVGSFVYSFGHPKGSGEAGFGWKGVVVSKITEVIIDKKPRKVFLVDNGEASSYGASGSPVLDLEGRLVGIVISMWDFPKEKVPDKDKNYIAVAPIRDDLDRVIGGDNTFGQTVEEWYQVGILDSLH